MLLLTNTTFFFSKRCFFSKKVYFTDLFLYRCLVCINYLFTYLFLLSVFALYVRSAVELANWGIPVWLLIQCFHFSWWFLLLVFIIVSVLMSLLTYLLACLVVVFFKNIFFPRSGKFHTGCCCSLAMTFAWNDCVGSLLKFLKC